MSDQLPLLAGYALAVLGFGLFFMNKNKAAGHVLDLKKLSDELEKSRKTETSSQKQVQTLRKEAGDQSQKIRSLEKEQDKLKERFEKQKSQEDQNLAELKAALEKAESKLEHERRQIEALTLQLQEVDAEKRELRIKSEESDSILKEKEKKLAAEFKDQLSSAKKKIRELEKDLKAKDQKIEKTKEKLQTADPVALKKARLRLSQYAHLYRLMRGQKEMAEERNSNWELALKLLSGWILKGKGKKVNQEDGIGQLVGEALEATKSGHLVDDDNGMAPPEPEAPKEAGLEHDLIKNVELPEVSSGKDKKPLEAFSKAVVVKKSEAIQ